VQRSIGHVWDDQSHEDSDVTEGGSARRACGDRPDGNDYVGDDDRERPVIWHWADGEHETTAETSSAT
jgi:hypothetical protein